MAKPKTCSGDQHARFLQAAREAGANVDTDAADQLMGRLAKMKPERKSVVKPKKLPKLPTAD